MVTHSKPIRYESWDDRKTLLGRSKTIANARLKAINGKSNAIHEIFGYDAKGNVVYSEWVICADRPLGYNRPTGNLEVYIERDVGGKLSYSKISYKTGQVISTNRAYREYFYE